MLSILACGCLPDERPALIDGGPIDADPTLPDAVPPPDAPPLEEGVTNLAGSEEPGHVDGPRNVARFANPVNIAVAADGTVYVADFDNGLIRSIATDGVVATVIDQPLFQRPFGLVFVGDTLYAETDDNPAGEHSIETGTLWRIDLITNTASPIAMNIGRPRGLAALGDGRIVAADMMHHVVSIIDPGAGDVTTLAGLRDAPGLVDGVGAVARFSSPYDVAVDGNEVIVSDFDNHCLRRVTLDGAVTSWVGACTSGFVDGTAAEARFHNPQGLAMDAAGNLYVTDIENYRVRRVDPAGNVTTYAGDGTPGFRDGDRGQARFYGLEGADIGPTGDYLYVSDGSRGEVEPFHRVRRITIE